MTFYVFFSYFFLIFFLFFLIFFFFFAETRQCRSTFPSPTRVYVYTTSVDFGIRQKGAPNYQTKVDIDAVFIYWKIAEVRERYIPLKNKIIENK